jgi:hypothetical protein
VQALARGHLRHGAVLFVIWLAPLRPWALARLPNPLGPTRHGLLPSQPRPVVLDREYERDLMAKMPRQWRRVHCILRHRQLCSHLVMIPDLGGLELC